MEASWPRCPRCHLPIGTGRTDRADCRECEGWPREFTRARYAYVLRPPADDLVHGLKYEGWSALAEEMGADMAGSLRGVDADLVVPVPTTAARVKERGYNQAALLARVVAERCAIPIADVLSRTRSGPTQVSLPPTLRRANVRGAFSAREKASPSITGAHVILVDDVLTTGSTGGSAAGELHRLGATSVTLCTFARALPYRTRAP